MKTSAPSTRALDVLVAIIVALLVSILIHFDPEGATRRPDALGYGLGIAASGALIFRRSRPLPVFIGILAIHFVYHLMEYPGAGPFPAIMVAIFGLAAAGLRPWAIAAASIVSLTAAGMQVATEGTALTSPTIVMPVVLSIASVLAGEAALNRSRYFAEVRERLNRAEAEREAQTQQRLTEERMRIARELHDVMAHTIAVITVQAAEAQDALDEYPEQTRTALKTIREASREAMSDLRATVGVLRDSAASGASRKPAPGLRDLAELVASTGGGPLHTRLEVTGEERPLPAAVELTAYRIVQESLTNVIRHASATEAVVTVAYDKAALSLEIEDNGSATSTPAGLAKPAPSAPAGPAGFAIPPAGPPKPAPSTPAGLAKPAPSAPGGPAGFAKQPAGPPNPPAGPAGGAPTTPAPSAGAAGHGISGMRERAESLGGSLEAGPRPGGGFRVSATLPLDRRP